MTLEIKQDPGRAAGYAWIEIAAALPDGQTTFRIEREHGSMPHLGPGGWQASPADLTPQDIQYTETGLRMVVGPDVVNHMPDYERIRVLLPAIGYDAEAAWPPIPPLRKARGIVVDSGPSRKPLDQGQQPPAPPPPTPQPEPSPDPEPAPPVDVDPPSSDIHDETPPRSSRLPLVAAALVLLALVAGLGAYLAFGWNDRPQAPGVQASLQDEPDAETLIKDPSTDPRRLYDLGLSLERATPPRTELAFEAIVRAAQRGIPEAALWIGRAYDPRYEIWRRVFGDQPDPSSALRYYRLAGQGTAQEGQTEAAGLCEWLKPKQRGGTDGERRAFEESCRS